MPERAPASMAMLHTVMRPSTDRARMVLPANSMAWPVPPAVPITPIICNTTSFAVQPKGNSPSTLMSMFLFFFISSVWVARTCSTSEVPMPKAKAPMAPCVLVCESPQTTVIPGSVAPCSGPITCTIPWRMSFMRNSVIPKVSQFLSRVSTCNLETGSAMPSALSWVGTLWSATARLALKRHGLRPARVRPSKACGLVTSCNNWRSIYNRQVPSSPWSTTWASQSLS